MQLRGIAKPPMASGLMRTPLPCMSFSAEAERELLLLLARSEKEIAGNVAHALDDVLAEADALLSDDGS